MIINLKTLILFVYLIIPVFLISVDNWKETAEDRNCWPIGSVP